MVQMFFNIKCILLYKLPTPVLLFGRRNSLEEDRVIMAIL